MRAIVVKCPQCGANLRVDDSVRSVTCTYCGTASQIQQRSRVFQVPQPMPPPQYPPPAYGAHPPPYVPQVPIARQKVSPAIFVVPMVMIMGLAGAVSYFVMSVPRAVQDRVQQAADLSKQRVHWSGGPPVITDVDGDGVGDLVGFVRYVLDGDRAHLAAFSGATGARLWQSEQLGKSADHSQTMTATSGELVYHVGDNGILHARNRKDGALLWSTPLGEKADCLCAGTAAGEVTLETADDQWWIIDAAGAKRPGPPLLRLDESGTKPENAYARFVAIGAEGAPGLCINLDNRTWSRPVQLLTMDNWTTMPKVPGMYPKRVVRRPGGPIVVVGYKQPGTQVPMLARVEGKKVAWTTEIPSADPLTSRSEDDIAAMTDRAIFVSYTPNSSSGPTLLAAFDLADGHRLWERPLDQGSGSLSLEAIVVTGDVVIATTWGYLQAFAQADGAARFTVGRIR